MRWSDLERLREKLDKLPDEAEKRKMVWMWVKQGRIDLKMFQMLVQIQERPRAD